MHKRYLAMLDVLWLIVVFLFLSEKKPLATLGSGCQLGLGLR